MDTTIHCIPNEDLYLYVRLKTQRQLWETDYLFALKWIKVSTKFVSWLWLGWSDPISSSSSGIVFLPARGKMTLV